MQKDLNSEIMDTCLSFIKRGQFFTGVDISNQLKLRGVVSDDGNYLRHRDVNEPVRRFMLDNYLPSNSNWQLTTIYPEKNANGNDINAPDGVFLYNIVGSNLSKYEVPAIIPPISTNKTYSPEVIEPVKPKSEIKITSSFSSTDDVRASNKNQWLFLVDCENAEKEEIIKALSDKIYEKVDKSARKLDKFGKWTIIDVTDCNCIITINIYNNKSKNDGFYPPKVYHSWDDFLKAYEEPKVPEEVKIPEPAGTKVISFISSKKTDDEMQKKFEELVDRIHPIATMSQSKDNSTTNLPLNHLPIESDGRVRIPKLLIDKVLFGETLNFSLGMFGAKSVGYYFGKKV